MSRLATLQIVSGMHSLLEHKRCERIRLVDGGAAQELEIRTNGSRVATKECVRAIQSKLWERCHARNARKRGERRVTKGQARDEILATPDRGESNERRCMTSIRAPLHQQEHYSKLKPRHCVGCVEDSSRRKKSTLEEFPQHPRYYGQMEKDHLGTLVHVSLVEN